MLLLAVSAGAQRAAPAPWQKDSFPSHYRAGPASDLLLRGGTLTPGADADLVVRGGDPLEPATNAARVIVEGRETANRSRQDQLAERYRDVRR